MPGTGVERALLCSVPDYWATFSADIVWINGTRCTAAETRSFDTSKLLLCEYVWYACTKGSVRLRMPQCLNITKWRASTQKEVVQWLDPKGERPKGSRHFIVVRSQLRPVDVYCYLVARFGKPNGFQNFLRRDDSDNLIHWDFNVKAGDADVYFAGTSREIQIVVSEALTDDHWKELILSIKHDYNRVGQRKSEVLRSLEKFVIFQNKYVSLARLCADLHAEIIDTPSYEPLTIGSVAYERDPEHFKTLMERISCRADKIYGECLKLRLLTPIMAEAFINMVILVLCKDAICGDSERYNAFLREKIPIVWPY